MADKNVKTIVRTVRRKDDGGVTKYWQTGLALASLVISGIVAYKVLLPNNKKQREQQEQLVQLQRQLQVQQQQQQQQQQSELPQMSIDPSQIVPMPSNQSPFQNMMPNGNGNGHSHQHHHPIPPQISPALSSNAERMIQREQMNSIPVMRHQQPLQQQLAPSHTQTQYSASVPSPPALNRINMSGDIV